MVSKVMNMGARKQSSRGGGPLKQISEIKNECKLRARAVQVCSFKRVTIILCRVIFQILEIFLADLGIVPRLPFDGEGLAHR